MVRIEEKIRQIWVIDILLDCKKRKQSDILKKLIDKSKQRDEIKKELKEKIATKLYKTLGILEKEGIVKRENDKHTRDKWAWLNTDMNTEPNPLYNILRKYSQSGYNGNRF